MLLISIFFLLLISSCCLFLYLKFSKYIPVLMYHRIASIPGDRNALAPEKFKMQLDYLATHGFSTITMQSLYEYYHSGKTLPPKPILLTFDDGYMDNYTEAMPLLNERQMTAAVFPIANWVGNENHWENFNKSLTKTMNWENLRSWHCSGLEIGSHTLDHPFLSKCTSAKLHQELQESKESLEKELDCPIKFLCYPYGDFNEQVCAAAKQAGYLAAFAIFEHVPLWKIDLYALPRIQISSRQEIWEFKLKVSKIHLIFVALRQWERNIKRRLGKK